MPAHVVEHLIAIGRLDQDGASRVARAVPCPRCQALTLLGLDHDKCAALIRVDPLPLSPLGEVAALLAGRATFQLIREARGYQIDSRVARQIQTHAAGTVPGVDIVAEHVCHAAELGHTDSRIRAKHHRRSIEDAPCPF